MKNNTLFRKGITLVVMLLFIGMVITPLTVSSEIEQYSVSTFNDGSLSGYVNDTSMNPIEGALVRVYFHGTYEENYTDSSGHFRVINIPICNCTKNCTASKEGYKTEWVLLGITENTTYDFMLYPLNPCYPVFNGTMGWNGWWVSPVTVSFVFDPEVVAEIWYYYNGLHNYTEPFVIDEEGEISVEWYWIDYEGVQSPYASFNVVIDQTPPDIEEVEWETFQEPPIFGVWYCKFTCNAVDSTSGMDRVELYVRDVLYANITGAGPVYEFILPMNVPWGEPVLNFTHYDIAGNSAFDLVNWSDIESYPYSQSYFMFFLRWLDRFPLLQRLLDVLGWYTF